MMEATTRDRLAASVRTLITRRRLMAALALGAIGRSRAIPTDAALRHVPVATDCMATATPECAQDNTVLTPGGPRPGDTVHQVAPDEVVRQDAEGNISVVHERAGSDARSLAQNDGLVLTPGGFRPESSVHQIQPDQLIRLDPTTESLQQIDISGEVVANLESLPTEFINPAILPTDTPMVEFDPNDEIATAGSFIVIGDEAVAGITTLPEGAIEPDVVSGLPTPPPLGSGWITFAGWYNTTGQTISLFRTTWTVPPPPATRSGQTIFFFNGLQDARNFIYQPVLQWGPSAAGGGEEWLVASWYVGGTAGEALHSPLVPVNVGDELVGVITLTGQSGGLFDYNCVFEGIPETSLSLEGVPELFWATEALEAYNVHQCSDYPATTFTELRNVDIQTSDTFPASQWYPVDRIIDCRQHVEVTIDANPNGGITMHYAAGES
jgi:hypothetical protein